jgi:hypothetical protein
VTTTDPDESARGGRRRPRPPTPGKAIGPAPHTAPPEAAAAKKAIAKKASAGRTGAKRTLSKKTVGTAKSAPAADTPNRAPARRAPAKKIAPEDQSAAPIVRRNVAPHSRLDAQEREDTRATHNNAYLRRYKAWNWHKLNVRLVESAAVLALLAICMLVLTVLMPDAPRGQVMGIAVTAVGLATGGRVVIQLVQNRCPSERPPDPPQ